MKVLRHKFLQTKTKKRMLKYVITVRANSLIFMQIEKKLI